MVKNTTGGTGTKALARKLQSRGDSRLQLADNEFEHYAVVTKLLGNGMCEIHLNDNSRLIGHIRNNFRGKNKRHNLVSLLSFVLVGLRHFEKPFKNCDILTIYDDSQILLLSQIPSLRIDHLFLLRNQPLFDNLFSHTTPDLPSHHPSHHPSHDSSHHPSHDLAIDIDFHDI